MTVSLPAKELSAQRLGVFSLHRGNAPSPSLHTWAAHATLRSHCNKSTYRRVWGVGDSGGKLRVGENALLSEEQGELSLRGGKRSAWGWGGAHSWFWVKSYRVPNTEY